MTKSEKLHSDVIEALRATATLVTCSISKWDAKIVNRGAMRDLNTLKLATGDTGEVRIKLLANADTHLKALCSELDMARTHVHYPLTLPWVTKSGDGARGPRLLPNQHFEEYIKRMAARKAIIAQAKEKFAETLPASIAHAQRTLGQLVNPADYPTVENILERFGIELGFEPIPIGSEFRGLDPGTLQQLADHMRTRTETMITNAMVEVWTKLKERIEHLVERLELDENGKTKKLHATLVTNLQELTAALGGFNLTKDPRIDELQRALTSLLQGVTIDDLRDNEQTRAATASAAKALKDKLNQWGI